MLGGLYVVTAVGVGVGYHRLLTHKSFETGPIIRFIWAVLGSMAVEGPVITWVAVHRKHHQCADSAGDPHSPHSCKDGASNGVGLLGGVWHAHVGWLFQAVPHDASRYVPDLLDDPVIRFVSRTFVFWGAVGLLIPALLGFLLTGTVTGVVLGFLWGGLLRILLVHQVTWSINSVCHLWGFAPLSDAR